MSWLLWLSYIVWGVIVILSDPGSAKQHAQLLSSLFLCAGIINDSIRERR